MQTITLNNKTQRIQYFKKYVGNKVNNCIFLVMHVSFNTSTGLTV